MILVTKTIIDIFKPFSSVVGWSEYSYQHFAIVIL